MDPNKMYISEDPFISIEYRDTLRRRVRVIQEAVQEALSVLNSTERFVIDGYYFDGRSFPHLATAIRLSLARVKGIHKRALVKLAVELTPFVERMFGIKAMHVPDCPICRAEWRSTAERLLDEKTPDMTWGQVAVRLARAAGWRAPSPRILTTHQKQHRRFEKSINHNNQEERHE
jgi:hypothetical protein